MTPEKARKIAHPGTFHPHGVRPTRALTGDQWVATSVLHHCRTSMIRSPLAMRDRFNATTRRVVSQEIRMRGGVDGDHVVSKERCIALKRDCRRASQQYVRPTRSNVDNRDARQCA
jgi:hypothetical protein